MVNHNDSPINQSPEDDFYRASVALAKAIPKCMDDPEVVDALAFSIAFFRYMLAVELDGPGLPDKYDIEIVRTIKKAYKEG